MFSESSRKPASKKFGGERPSRTEELGLFKRYLETNGLKHSRQREVVLRSFLEAEGHVSVDELYSAVHEEHPDIGRSTVYRTLKLLCAAELAEPIQLNDGLVRFERRQLDGHHDHLICIRCGAVWEFLNSDIEKLQDEVAAAHSFAIDSHVHQIFGVCRSCRAGECLGR